MSHGCLVIFFVGRDGSGGRFTAFGELVSSKSVILAILSQLGRSFRDHSLLTGFVQKVQVYELVAFSRPWGEIDCIYLFSVVLLWSIFGLAVTWALDGEDLRGARLEYALRFTGEHIDVAHRLGCELAGVSYGKCLQLVLVVVVAENCD